MPRRKQSRPQANAGPVEARFEPAPAAPTEVEDEEECDAALEAWEEEHAYQDRPSKRQKKRSNAADQGQLPLVQLQQLWQFASVTAHLQHPTQLAALQQASTFELGDQHGEAAGVTMVLPGIIGYAARVNLPSVQLREALSQLLAGRYLALGPVVASASAASQPSSRAAPVGGEAQVGISFTSKALDSAATWAEDRRQSKWQIQLLLLLRWLVPHCLDPDADAQGASGELLAGTSLDSPLAAAGTGAVAAGGGDASLGTAGQAPSQPTSPRAPYSPRHPTSASEEPSAFDAAELYAAVKPTGRESELDKVLPELRPTLRRYQRRAARWMVECEQRSGPSESVSSGDGQRGRAATGGQLHPLWGEVPCAGENGAPSSVYVNCFTGRLALQRFSTPPMPKGGILADQMGLGKTVELLACIAAHKYPGPSPTFHDTSTQRAPGRPRKERVECVCGASDSTPDVESYDGMWLQCESCLAWQHGACVGHPARRVPGGAFTCGACQRAVAAATMTQPCGTTCIIAPTPILQQWRQEIEWHVRPGALKVLVYLGQSNGGSGSRGVVSAADLAAADIVLTTYDVLRQDFNRQPHGDDEAPQRSMRRQKRYEVLPTPLTRLRFWRVCLDEAQMVESSTAKAAAMALQLKTVHRWAVTGTPISRGLEDLQGLLAFLQVEPWCDRFWWTKAVQRPCEAGSAAAYDRLLRLLRPGGPSGGLLWRSSKADVAHELGLPPQHHHLSKLKFSAIERHFYTRQHQECVGAARAALSPQVLAGAQAAGQAILLEASALPVEGTAGPMEASRPDPPATATAAAAAQDDPNTTAAGASASAAPFLASDNGTFTSQQEPFENRPLTAREERKLLHPLLRLRQACVHPQVGAGGIRQLTAAKAPMSMTEVLEVLLTKARVEAEEALRVLLAALNGLAGLLLLQGLQAEAARAYREALRVVEVNAAQVRADKLQQLHALHNLAEVLESSTAGRAGGAGTTGQEVPRTLRDAGLRAQATALREGYMAESIARLAGAERELTEAQAAVDRPRGELQKRAGTAAEGLLGAWWVDAVHLIVHHTPDGGVHAAEHIKAELSVADGYRFVSSRNAASITSRFRDLFGLQSVLSHDINAMTAAGRAAMDGLRALAGEVADPPAALVQLAACCPRCVPWMERRGGSTRSATSAAAAAAAARICRHCRLDETFLAWEVRLFSVVAAAREAGATVSAEEALQRAHADTLRRVGMGGLGEIAGPLAEEEAEQDAGGSGGGGAWEGSSSRRTDAVARSVLMRQPSEAERALSLLLGQLRQVKLPATAVPQREVVVAAGKAHLEQLEAQRRQLYIKGRALALQQRQQLNALDELSMCTSRLVLRAPGEMVLQGEELFKVREAEIPVRSAELSADKAVAAADLARTLGTLRYLLGLKEQQAQRAAAATAAAAVAGSGRGGSAAGEAASLPGSPHSRAAAAAAAATSRHGMPFASQASPAAASQATAVQYNPFHPHNCHHHHHHQQQQQQQGLAPAGASAFAAAGGEGQEVCPICHDPLGSELAMLPCGHRLCCRCSLLLVERLPASTPAPARRIACPTCRVRVAVAEVAYVDTGSDDVAASGEGELERGYYSQQQQQQGTGGHQAVQQGEQESEEGGRAAAAAFSAAEGAVLGSGGYGLAASGASAVSAPWLAYEAGVRVAGSYGRKIEAVVRRLVGITRSDPGARVLLFCSWKDGLELVSHALTANSLPHVYPKTGRKFEEAVAAFTAAAAAEAEAADGAEAAGTHAEMQASGSVPAAGAAASARNPQKQQQQHKGQGGQEGAVGQCLKGVSGGPPRVLLMLVKQGANGLNLQAANHVVFVEPLLDPAEEAQAMGRVDRIGQRRATHVHRFVIAHSVEESVHRLGRHRAAAMDLASVAVKRGRGRGAMTLQDVAVLLADHAPQGGGGG